MKNLLVLSYSILLLIMSCQDASKKIKDSTNNESNKTTSTPETKPEINAQIIDSNSGSSAFNFTNNGGKVWDFGTIKEGDTPDFTFTFQNTGSEPMIISNAKGSCGCTVPQWPKEPIAPGATGEINVKFNSKNKKGKQTKTVTLTANTTPPTTKLRVIGTIEEVSQ